MNSKSVSTYLSGIDRLSQESKDQNLEIERARQYLESDPGHPFYRGELAFYEGRFALALKFYFEWETHAAHPFFCYRAAAALLNEQCRYEEASDFASRALKIKPHDPFILSLIEGEEIIEQSGQEKQSLSGLDELAHIFQSSSEKAALFE